MKNQIKQKNYNLKLKGIPLKSFEDMNIGEIRKLNKQYNKLINENERR